MPKLSTLRDDIYRLLSGEIKFTEEQLVDFGHSLAARLVERLGRVQGPQTLRLSNLGKPCARQLWYSIKRPDLAEPLPPAARMKFLFGDLIEGLVLFLAKVAGHEVKNEQQEVTLHGVVGHIDADIDGSLVDVKSASTPSMRKFEAGLKPETDAFGYLTQLGTYAKAKNREDGAFIAVDKTLGHIIVDHHVFEDKDYEGLVTERREILARGLPPPRGYNDQPEGESGNRKLGFNCSYCDFKKTCWPGLRTFIYAQGKPVYLTNVSREPRVPEAKE